MPTISIITPSYNQAPFLEHTIRSVLAQDCTDLEYIIVDGGSDDGSIDIIKHYQEEIAWWVSEPDEGQADAINKGFLRASGEFVAWLNSDDLYLPGAVNQAVAELRANPELGMVYGDAITIDGEGRPLNRLSFGDWGLLELMSFHIICQPAVFMRRRTLEEAGGLDPTYHYMLDHQLWIRIANIALIKHIANTLATARHHPLAKNVSQPAGFSQETQSLLSWMEKQKELAPILADNRRQILAGAHRLAGRYLLDGGQPAEALSYYSQALLENPVFALKHWHRMIYAILSLLGAGSLANDYYRWKDTQKHRQSILQDSPATRNWPGLQLE
ncbi:MAG: glycosyltransferase family 2 protein [Chloroflexota bacterium]|nr:glycosyltransferase family 2 protein [Chloroflexota bacterium]